MLNRFILALCDILSGAISNNQSNEDPGAGDVQYLIEEEIEEETTTFEDEARSSSSFGGLGCILGSFGAPVDFGGGGSGG